MDGPRFLIFDCDGVLADTERAGHLPAFNRTFAEFGVPITWSDAEYAEKVKIGGGKERMLSVLTDEFTAAHGMPQGAEERVALVAAWHRRKTEIYTQMVEGGELPPRSGVARLTRAALEGGWQVAVASTSARPSVLAVVRYAVGEDLAREVSVFAGDIVPRKKPAPDIYLHALEELGAQARWAVAIEDSGGGLAAAVAARIRTVVTVSAYTADDDFSRAALVVDSLGDPGEPARVIADPYGVDPGGTIDLDVLERVLSGPAPVAV